MTKVRIVGGGLTGVLAAFEAHRLGCRDIEIHERLEQLGGDDLPDRPQGLELRDEQIDFGPRGGPLRRMLEWRGVAFDEVDGDQAGAFGPGQTLPPVAPTGGSLADWIRAHPPKVAEALGRYCQWRLSAWLDEMDESAAAPLGLDGRMIAPPTPPRGGVAAMFGACLHALRDLGVKVRTQDLVSPWRVLQARAPDETVVWAADPTPLFKACDLPTPKQLYVSSPTYFFRLDHEAAAPIHIRNLAAEGVVAELRGYESRGESVLAVECVAEAPDALLRREICRLAVEARGTGLAVGEQLGVSLRPRRGYRSADAAHQLKRLRLHLAETAGEAIVTDAWEPFAPADRFAALRVGLAAALARHAPAIEAAA